MWPIFQLCIQLVIHSVIQLAGYPAGYPVSVAAVCPDMYPAMYPFVSVHMFMLVSNIVFSYPLSYIRLIRIIFRCLKRFEAKVSGGQHTIYFHTPHVWGRRLYIFWIWVRGVDGGGGIATGELFYLMLMLLLRAQAKICYPI